MEIDEWMQKNGKTRNKWGNWPNIDVREYKSWLESQPKETEKKNDVDLDTNKDGKAGPLEKLVGKSKIAAFKRPTLDDAKKFAQDFFSKNPNADGSTMWDSFLNSIDETNRKFYEKNQQFQSIMKGYRSKLNTENSGTVNDKGDMSKSGNMPAVKLENKLNDLKIQPKTTESAFRIETFENAARKALENMEGKSEKEQKEIVSEILPEKKEQEEEKKDIAFKITPEKKDIAFKITPEKKDVTFSETAEEIEQAERDKEINDKSSAFLKSWAATHPSWLKILSSSDLSWGQKVALVGSALANIGANVTLGAKAGFEHSGFNGVPWDFKQAIDKYTNQEIENVLNAEQNVRAKELYANLFADMAEKYGDDKMQEIFAIADAYGDNPAQLKARLEAIGVKEDANAIKEAYKNREKISAEEQAKREKLDTEIKQAQAEIARLEAVMKTLDKEQKEALNKKIIEAQEAIQDYTKTKYKSDTKTYNLEKTAGYIHNIIKEAEGIAGTVGGVLTGGVVGSTSLIKDGIVRAKGIPQKIVRADGSEIQLDPNDNVYATKNELTTEKDDGSDIVHMTQNDEAVTVQKRLGYAGGAINKDFDYYLSKLRG